MVSDTSSTRELLFHHAPQPIRFQRHQASSDNSMLESVSSLINLPGLPIIELPGIPIIHLSLPDSSTTPVSLVSIELHGSIRLPTTLRPCLQKLRARLTCSLHDGAVRIDEVESEEILLGPLQLAAGVTVVGCILSLRVVEGYLTPCIRAAISFASLPNYAIQGTLFSPIFYSDEENEPYLPPARILDSILNLPGQPPLSDGMICITHSSASEVPHDEFPVSPTEDDMPLFHLQHPLRLGEFLLENSPSRQFGFIVVVEASAVKKPTVNLVFPPSRVRTPIIGDKTVLFIHGEETDHPFAINPEGPWSARISPNIHLHLLPKTGDRNVPLVDDPLGLFGTVTGFGYTITGVQIEAEGAAITLFPESHFPQETPLQKISLTIHENGDGECALRINPITIGAFSIHQQTRPGELLNVHLVPEGFKFEDIGLYITGFTEQPIRVDSFLADGSFAFQATIQKQLISLTNKISLTPEKLLMIVKDGSAQLKLTNCTLTNNDKSGTEEESDLTISSDGSVEVVCGGNNAGKMTIDSFIDFLRDVSNG
ncbi:MAG: hypothetical protein JW795_20760 [Chitinivibrionales bacterium]|nr:hypothetical protein [Chitinivibrionales bacterium]